MAILNYTTKITVSKTASQIQEILGRSGASNVSVDYRNGTPVAIMFGIEIKGKPVWFRLPTNSDGVMDAMKRDRVPRGYINEKQAARTAWRIIKVWIEAQMAIIEADVAKMEEVFLPYAVAPDGRTLFEHFEEAPGLLLQAHKKS